MSGHLAGHANPIVHIFYLSPKKQIMKFNTKSKEEITPIHISFWNNPKNRSLLYQGILLLLVLAVFYFLFITTSANLKRLGISSGFDFMWRVSGFDVAMKLVHYNETSTYFKAFWVGFLNTLLMGLLSIFSATLLGFLMGVLRSSSNWLAARFAGIYVEFNRNIPLLLHLLFWYFAVLRTLPGVRNSVVFSDVIFLNIRGLYLPKPIFESGFWGVPFTLFLSLVLTFFLARWARRRRNRTGQPFPTIYYSIGLIIALPLLAAVLTGFPVSWIIPKLKGFNFVGGIHVIPEFIALWIALTVYSSAFIAEIVRGGIQAIDRAQFEAAYALGLGPKFTMLLVVIPQALRIIIPPLGNMHITILKDSSLAAAIGYPDLMLIFGGTVLSQTGQVLEVMGIVMAVYLVICLAISSFINLYNRRTAWGER